MKKTLASNQLQVYLEQLKLQKVKVTDNRRKVLQQFLDSSKPWTLTSLQQSFASLDEIDPSSVYRALEALHSAGLLEAFYLPGDRQKYFSLIKLKSNQHERPHSKQQHHHHHIVCQDCGTVSHLDICMPPAWLGKVEDNSGFQITEHRLEFKGLCAQCR